MVWVVLGLLACSALIAWVLVFELLRKYGALVVRFDRLEERLAASRFEHDDVAAGVAPGTQFPPFSLQDIRGGTKALDDYRGKRVMLVHWSPGCGFCDVIAPDLATAAPQLREHNTELVLISSGDAETNRTLAPEHGLDGPILLQTETTAVAGFAGVGTPAAYLLDEEGRVESGLVLGADKVPELLREALNGRRRLPSERPLSDSRIERAGIKPGTAAPAFSLPAVDGGTVSLDDHRDRRVLLVFSDPHCGPCEELMPQLVAAHDRAYETGVQLVMVSRGELEENRRKCKEHGIRFPVGIQRGWRLSKEYGIFATPVAFLIDSDGVIARPVAQGPEAIVALLQAELGARKEERLNV